MSPLRRLVVGERLRRVDVAERGVAGDELWAAGTPKRFASTEPSAITFISPKPGSAPIRRRSSDASPASVQIRSACPP